MNFFIQFLLCFVRHVSQSDWLFLLRYRLIFLYWGLGTLTTLTLGIGKIINKKVKF